MNNEQEPAQREEGRRGIPKIDYFSLNELTRSETEEMNFYMLCNNSSYLDLCFADHRIVSDSAHGLLLGFFQRYYGDAMNARVLLG